MLQTFTTFHLIKSLLLANVSSIMLIYKVTGISKLKLVTKMLWYNRACTVQNMKPDDNIYRLLKYNCGICLCLVFFNSFLCMRINVAYHLNFQSVVLELQPISIKTCNLFGFDC